MRVRQNFDRRDDYEVQVAFWYIDFGEKGYSLKDLENTKKKKGGRYEKRGFI